jgi:hypothetical protein
MLTVGSAAEIKTPHEKFIEAAIYRYSFPIANSVHKTTNKTPGGFERVPQPLLSRISAVPRAVAPVAWAAGPASAPVAERGVGVERLQARRKDG